MQTGDPQLDTFVAQAGARLRWSAAALGLCWWLAVCLGLWLVLFLGDSLLSLPAGLRLPLSLGGALFSGLHLFRKVLRPALQRRTPEQTALLLEQRYGIRENLLINAVQFERREFRPEEMPFARETIAASARWAGRIRSGDLWDGPALGRWGSAAGLVLALWMAFIVLLPRQFGAAGARYLLPLGDVPPPGNISLKLIPAEDVTVFEGEGLAVTVDVWTPRLRGLREPPLMVWQEKTGFVEPVQGGGESAPMQALGHGQSDEETGPAATRSGNSCMPSPTSRPRSPSASLPGTAIRAAFG